MAKKHIIAALAVMLASVFFGCSGDAPVTTEHHETEVNYYDKYNIDVSKEGVLGEDGVLRITEAGKYYITGKAEEGRILVEAPPRAEVIITLDGVSLTSTKGVALDIQMAGDVTLAVRPGSRNFFSVPENATIKAAAIRTSAPLTVEGDGSLELVSALDDGIYTKRDLRLNIAMLSVSSSADGIRAEGEESSILIEKGANVINAKGTALKTAGNVTLEGGDLTAEGCSVGIEALNSDLKGGRIIIESKERGYCSAGTLKIAGTRLNIKSDGDGVMLEGEDARFITESGLGNVKAALGVGVQAPVAELKGGTLKIASKKTGLLVGGAVTQLGTELTIESSADGIKSTGEGASILIENGTSTVSALTAALTSERKISIVGGKLTARDCAVGVTAQELSLEGGRLSVTAREDGVFAENKLSLCGTTLSVKSDWDGVRTGAESSSLQIEDGIHSINAQNKAITSAGSISITGGQVTAEANSIGIIASEINLTGGKVRVVTLDDGIYTNGTIKLDGTDVTVKSESDGIRADGDDAVLLFESGKYVVSAKGGALCSTGSASVLGGEISVEESAVGINSPEISLKDGKIEIYSSELAFDSLKDVSIEGGDVLVSVFSKDSEKSCSVTPEDTKISHTGGTFISFSNDYANFSDATTICSINIGFTDTFTSGDVRITNAKGASILRLTSKQQIQYASISSPELEIGNTYQFSAGKAITKVELQKQIVRQKFSAEPGSFTEHAFKASNGTTVRYYLYTPAYATDNMPIVVFLHGSGEAGSNLALLTNPPCLPKYLKEGTLTPDCYVIMPQCYGSWTAMAEPVEELIEHSRKTLSKENGLVSLTGFSLGGGGVWTLAMRHPERYNKIAPLSGYVNASPANVKKLIGLPVWDFVGLADYNVSPTASKAMTDALKKAGSEVYVTQFKGAGHSKVPGLTYLGKHTYSGGEISILEWLTTPRKN